MTADPVGLQERFGSDCVHLWEPSAPALAGWLPGGTPVVSPADLEAAAEVLRFASAERWRVLPAGAMEHLYLGAPPGRVDLVLSSRRLDRILEYEPEDLTLVAAAGATLHEIEARAHAHGQRLAPDPWPGTAATLGGACAANRAGLRRLRSGTLRDHVLGARVVHADGMTTRTGGKVVKNVTGYDLAKLYVGSAGSLVFLAEINVRLAPRPDASALVHAMLAPAAARDRLLDVHRSWLQPVALLVMHGARLAASRPDLEPTPRGLHLFARFEGRVEAVRVQVEECRRRLGGVEIAADQGETIWQALARIEAPEPDQLLLQLSTLPTTVVDTVAAATDAGGGDVLAIGLFGVGTSWVRLPAGRAGRLGALRTRVEAMGGRVRVVWAPADLRHLVAPLAPPAPTLQAALKAAYDPESRLAPAPFATAEDVAPAAEET